MPCSVDLPGACTDKGECIPTAGNCESPLNCTLTVCCEESQGLVYCLDGDFDIPCIGDCGGKECGDNGCGGSCGGCGEGFACDGSGSCANVDECALGLDDCDPNATCTDTAGGYLCTCDESLDAWQGDWSLEYVETCKNSDMDGLTFGMHCGSAIGDKVSCDYEIGGILTGSCDIAITSGSCNSFKLDYTGCTLTEPGYTNTATVSMDIADSASGTFSASSGECGTVTISKKAPLSGACCETSTEPGCPETPFCEACVCGLDSFCCDSGWDFVCALIATAECKTPCECGEPCVPACGDKECGDDGCGGTCGECGDGGFCTDDGDCIEDPVFGKCCEPSDDPGCAETPFCEACVCGQDSFCCNNSWDTLCAGIATGDCETPCECDVPCLPQCEGLNCGDNGCEGSCGTCSGDQGCAQGVCTDPCPLVNLCLESPGDVNGDGTTDISDVQCGIVAALWELAGSFGAMPMCCKGEWWRTDMNCDQGTNIVDVLMGINMALKIPMAAGLDADGNGCPDACQAAPDPGCDILFDE
jgi:hypothetical protein